ncbi:metallophosphoesterase [Bradyrhizobium sp. 23AC]
MAVKFLKDYKTYPRMVHWFNPILLVKLLNNVITSAMFGQYADRRLMVAALDSVPPEVHLTRATAFVDGLSPTQDGPVWLDFVADLGDGFDSTFAVACLLARKELDLDGVKLPRGQMLIMGGDEVYPLANAQTYKNQLRQPYQWASPDHDRKDVRGVPLFAIPGNHDWYDGLVQFLAYFTRPTPTHFGTWRTQQRRSYFAIQLTKSWWLWAMDIQLAEDMDQPQADYFNLIAQSNQLLPGSKIILCTAEPGWLYTDTNTKSWEIVDYALYLANRANKKLTIPLLLSGDTHHYSRYQATDGAQFVTSGGGGAFLHPTHQLEKDVSVRWNGRKVPLTLANKDQTEEPAVYLPMETSRRLLWRNLWFALTNWDFSVFMALVYFSVGVLVGLRDEIDIYILVALALGSGIIGYTTTQENVSLSDIYRKWRRRRINPGDFDALAGEKLWLQFKKATVVVGSSLIHVAAHVGTAIVTARWFASFNAGHFVLSGSWYSVWKWLGILSVEMGVVGFALGSTYFGLNMLLTCRWLRMNRNDAFSALRIGHFNNFLRLCIQGDDVQVHAVGLENVPKRGDWNDNPHYKVGNPAEPRWVPSTPLLPHLIETFTVSGRSGPA